ncbi:MAG: ribose transport system substrate-binding protein [Pseudonocardiales bacterium]|jgi:ribose transport system substrate-binding protein|nr:ribose transport system substrate-binding protein [Pseudonocardiales bacterium]MDT4919468.1 ribose transport system substrate-binding protein [Pseudonocardiales bacterium]
MSACSKSSSSNNNTGSNTTPAGGQTTSAATDPALQAAAQRVQDALTEPTSVGVTEPLSKKPDAGKNITYLQCGVGICQQIGDELTNAVKLLGWHMTFVDQGTTPEQIVAAWDRALSASPKPDAILTSGVPNVVYQRQLDQARQAGIPVVDWASANKPGTPGIIFDINPVEDNQERGKLLADYAATTTNGSANSVFIDVPDFPTLVAERDAYVAEMKSVCPACKTDTLDFPATDIGTKVPSAIVSYLQQHPDVNYLTMSFDDMSVGVAEALKAAGLDGNVKIIGQSSNQTAAQSIATGGLQVATIPQGVGQMAYKALDVLARQFNGDSLDADSANLLPIWIQTKDTIGDPNNLWKGPAGYADQFAALWHVS